MELEPEPPEVAAARADPRRHFGPYLALRELGRGGMGVVYEAWDPRSAQPGLGRRVALKRLLEQAGERARVRFEREARLGAALDHPGIAKLHDAAFEGPGAPYLVMEMVRGQPLEKLVDEDQPAPVRRSVELVAAAARALDHAHGKGVVHRDVKPQNIMVREDGSVVLLDLGLARGPPEGQIDVTATGSILGTPAFLAPEQITDARSAGPSADIYGLGGTLYALLAGQPPFSGPSGAVLAMVRSAAPEPPSARRKLLDPELDRICLRCLAKEPTERYPSAAALADALEAWLRTPAPGASGGSATPAGRAPPTLVVAAAGFVAGGLVAGGLFAALHPRHRRPETPSAAATAEAPTEQEPEAPTPATTAPPPPVTTAAPPPETTAPPPPTEAPPVATEPPPATDTAPKPARLSRAQRKEIDRLLADATARGKKRDHAGAEGLDTQALAIGPNEKVYADRGFRRFCQGNYQGAVEDYRAALELAPAHALYYSNLGINLGRLGERQAALDAFDKAIALDATDANSFMSRSEVRAYLGDATGARDDAETACRLDPKSTDAWAAGGYASFALKDYARAAECYGKAIELEPKSSRLWANRAHNRAMAGDLNGAIADADEAIRLDPSDPFAYKKRGYCRAQRHDLQGAIEDLERVLQLDPRDRDAAENLAACRRALEEQPRR